MPINTYCCNSKIDQNLHLHLGISKVNHQIMALLQCEILQNNMGCTWWEFFFNNNFIRTDFQVLATRVPCNIERASVLKFERFKIASLEQVVLQTCQGQTVRMHVRQALGFDELEYPKYSRMQVNQHHEMHTSVPYYTSSQSLENSIEAFKVQKPQRNIPYVAFYIYG